MHFALHFHSLGFKTSTTTNLLNSLTLFTRTHSRFLSCASFVLWFPLLSFVGFFLLFYTTHERSVFFLLRWFVYVLCAFFKQMLDTTGFRPHSCVLFLCFFIWLVCYDCFDFWYFVTDICTFCNTKHFLSLSLSLNAFSWFWLINILRVFCMCMWFFVFSPLVYSIKI